MKVAGQRSSMTYTNGRKHMPDTSARMLTRQHVRVAMDTGYSLGMNSKSGLATATSHICQTDTRRTRYNNVQFQPSIME